ncbi:MAG TPA: cache domain-containing protein, partial [Methanomicrobiales archaeon]|nr:cache domain-containing protein [Methanomicrobiales archaeon]
MQYSRLLPFLMVAIVLAIGCTSAPISSNDTTPIATTSAVPPVTNLSTTLARFTTDTNATLQQIDSNVATAATDLGRTGGITGPEANTTLAWLAASSPDTADAVTMDPQGRIAAAMPEEYWGAVGADVSNESHNQEALREKKPQMTPVFAAVEGFDAAGIRRPVTNGTGAFLGLVEAVFKPKMLLGDSANRSLNGTNFTAWAIDTSGLLLYDRDGEELVSHNIFTDPIFADYPELRTLAERMVTEPSGSGSYTFNASGGGPAVTKDAVWGTSGIHGA